MTFVSRGSSALLGQVSPLRSNPMLSPVSEWERGELMVCGESRKADPNLLPRLDEAMHWLNNRWLCGACPMISDGETRPIHRPGGAASSCWRWS